MPSSTRNVLTFLTLAAACLAPVACAGAADPQYVAAADSSAVASHDSLARARQDSVNRAQPEYVVDSILPIEEEVRRFRSAVGGDPALALTGGAPSIDALVQSFARAVTAADTAALRQLALTPREFIDLVYPDSPYTKPPYRQSPALTWSQIQLPSATGARRLLERLGGRPLRVGGVECAERVERQGANRLHTGCRVEFVSGSDSPKQGRLFGSIIERAGQFKFVSFANQY